MRRIYLLSVAALAAAGMMAAPVVPSFLAKSKNTKRTEVRKVAKKRAGVRAKADNAIWRPALQIVSEWNPDEETWEESSRFLTTYDSAGRILTDEETSLAEGITTRTIYVYDEYGMAVSRLVLVSFDGENFENYSRAVREYDPVVHDCIVSNTEYLWRDGTWQEMGNCYRRDVTRNELGNVTGVVIRTLYDGNYEASQKIEVEYGADNVATAMKSFVLTFDYDGEFVWQPEMEYTDMKWDHTNGQLLSMDDITTAGNGISSAVVYDADGENLVSVEYPDADGSFKSHLTYEMGELNVSFLVVDSYGSYDYSQTEIYREEGEEDYSYTSVERYRVNEYGLETEIFSGEAEGDDELYPMYWTVGEVEANPDYGYPDLFTVSSYNLYDDEFYQEMQIKFEGYSNVVGVNSISGDDAHAPAEYFNLQGIRVSGEPESGLYIRRQGAEVTKVLK